MDSTTNYTDTYVESTNPSQTQENLGELGDMMKENLLSMQSSTDVNQEDEEDYSEELKDSMSEGQTVYEQLQQKLDKLCNRDLHMPMDRKVSSIARVQKKFQNLVLQDNRPKEMKGYIQKKSPSFFRGWQDRYVVLKDRKMCYYEKELDADPKGIINFDLAKAEVKYIDKKQFQILIEGCDRTFLFRSHEESIAEEWVNEIRKHIEESKKSLNVSLLNTKSIFWRFDTISEQQFVNLADTGDILLFRCKQLGSKITRTFTNSHFDHVAMVLKFETDPDEVYFVESTSNRGVSIARWTMIRKFVGDFYEQVVLRHLELERTDALIDKLEVFLKEAVGNKYGISTSKLFFQRSTVKPKKGNYIDDDRTFFCSELVAKAYKVLDIMEEDGRPCNHFYPSSFSSKSQALKLAQGASLGPELNILLDNIKLAQEELQIKVQQPQEQH